MIKYILANIIALNLVFALLTCTAQAHVSLVHSSPSDAQVLTTAPKTIQIEFSGPIEVSFSKFMIQDGTREWKLTPIESNSTTLKKKALITLVAPQLNNGRYELNWSVFALDGHRQSGHSSFTIQSGG